jgi:hypothetical protein
MQFKRWLRTDGVSINFGRLAVGAEFARSFVCQSPYSTGHGDREPGFRNIDGNHRAHARNGIKTEPGFPVPSLML